MDGRSLTFGRIAPTIGRLFWCPSFDPQPVFFVPVLDRQFEIAVEAVVIGADLRFDPARLVAQQQLDARRHLFDSGSVFAALLGGPEHGRWLITPADRLLRLSRCYRDETGILVV